MPIDRRIPVVLLTGFLGSGKTSLLSQLLRQPAMQGSAVLINEIGAVGLDHLLVEALAEEVCLLESGCLCCAVRGDLSRSLRALFMRRLRREIGALDRVIIETTGLADPVPVIRTLTQDFFLAERFRLDGVLTTLDARHGPGQLDEHPEAVKQLALADRIVLTKCDLVGPEALAEIRARAAVINPLAGICQSEAGMTPDELLAGMLHFSLEGKPEIVKRWMGEAVPLYMPSIGAKPGGLGRARPSSSVHDARIATHLLRFEPPFAWADFARAMDALQADCGADLLRIKGLVAVAGEAAPRVFHAVQHQRYPSSTLPAWPDEDRATRLVFIVRDVPRERLEAAFR